MKNNKFCVYMHKFPNGKMYIGITSKKPKARWQNGTGYTKEHQSVMYNAIQKYGWDNVEHFILYNNLTETEAKQKEIELIKKYNTYIHFENSNGYNMTLGGEGTLGHKVSEEVKNSMREKKFGKRGDLCCNSQSVICDGIRYESITQFCEKNNLNRGTVEAWLTGKNHMPKEWLDKNLRKEFEKDKRIKNPQDKNFKDRIKYDGIIYESQAELANYLNVSKPTLCNWLNGKTKIPINIYEKGIEFVDRPNIELKSTDIPSKTILEYDGKIYNSQVELANFLKINKATLNTWITGKVRLPKKYADKGLKVLDGYSNIRILEEPYIKEVDYNGKTYKSISSLAKELNINSATLRAWLHGKNKMPKEYKEKGLKFHNK